MLYQNKNNEVMQFTEIDKINGFIPKDFKQLTEAQIIAYQNKPFFGVWNGNEWVKDDEKCEQERVDLINQKASDIIYSKYSIEKQSSAQLGIYGDEYLATMKVFIKQVIDISNKAIDDKILADEVNWEGLDK